MLKGCHSSGPWSCRKGQEAAEVSVYSGAWRQQRLLCSDTCANPFFPPAYFCLHRNGMFTHGLSDIIAPFFLLSHYCKLKKSSTTETNRLNLSPQVNVCLIQNSINAGCFLFILTDRLSLCNTVWLRIHCVYEAGLKLPQLSCPGRLRTQIPGVNYRVQSVLDAITP